MIHLSSAARRTGAAATTICSDHDSQRGCWPRIGPGHDRSASPSRGLHKAKAPWEPLSPRGHPLDPSKMPGHRPPWCELWLHTTSCPAVGQSHLRQGLNPTVPAPPVGPSPGFRAVACICVVASPNEVIPLSVMRAPPPRLNRSLTLLIRTAHYFVKKKARPGREKSLSGAGFRSS